MNNRNFRMDDKHWSLDMWNRIKGWLTDLDERVSALEQGSAAQQRNTVENSAPPQQASESEQE